MEDAKKPQRRLILPEKKTKVDLQISNLATSPETVVRDGLEIAAMELARYRAQVGKGQPMDASSARIVQGWIKSMTDLMKEHREQERAANFEKFSDEELALLAKKVLQNGGSVVEIEQQDENEDESVD